ncbi:MAG: amidohydrolase family protein [Gammaproteobacteria bacterium]
MQIFDAHFHIIDTEYPLVANQGYLPPSFTCEDYKQATSVFDSVGGVIVSGSFQAYDQNYLMNALTKLGKGYVGITQLPITVSDEQIIALNTKGIRGIRFNLYRGESQLTSNLKQLGSLAQRVYNLAKWHVECYVHSCELTKLLPFLQSLPKLSIDHLGLSKDGFEDLLCLVKHGAKVKASGFGRVDLDISTALQEICKISADALIFGTDLPSTRAPRPFLMSDIALIQASLGEELSRKVLRDNGLAFYCGVR